MTIYKRIIKLCATGTALATLAMPHIASAGEPIDIWVWNINAPLLSSVAAEYMQTHPGTEINVLELGKGDVEAKSVIGMQAGGQGLPDVLLVEDNNLQGYLENWPSLFLNLSERGYDKHKGSFPNFKIDLVTQNNAIYAMPFDIGPVGVFYRPSYFEQAGIDPQSIHTWDDYIAAGKAIKEKTGAQMTNVSFDDDGLFRVLMNQNGGYYFDAEGNIDLNNPKAIEAMELIATLNNNELLYTGAKGWSGFTQALATGKIVAVVSGAWLQGSIEQQAPDTKGDWGVFPLPKGSSDNQSANLGGSNFVLFKNSKNVDLAYDFMEYFTTTTSAQVASLKGGLFPSYTPVFAEPIFDEPSAFFSGQAINRQLADASANVPSMNFTLDFSIAYEESIKAFTEVIVKKADPVKALAKMAKQLKNRTGRSINQY